MNSLAIILLAINLVSAIAFGFVASWFIAGVLVAILFEDIRKAKCAEMAMTISPVLATLILELKS